MGIECGEKKEKKGWVEDNEREWGGGEFKSNSYCQILSSIQFIQITITQNSICKLLKGGDDVALILDYGFKQQILKQEET